MLWQADIEKFKRMQQTAQSNRSRAEGTNTTRQTLERDQLPEEVQPVSEMESQSAHPKDSLTNEQPVPRTSAEVSVAAGKQLPSPPGKAAQNRRSKHMNRRKDVQVQINTAEAAGGQLQESQQGEAGQAGVGPQTDIVVAPKEQISLESRRTGSVEGGLMKLPGTHSHSKSESDLERPHQVSVTADGAGPPVTRAIV